MCILRITFILGVAVWHSVAFVKNSNIFDNILVFIKTRYSSSLLGLKLHSTNLNTILDSNFRLHIQYEYLFLLTNELVCLFQMSRLVQGIFVPSTSKFGANNIQTIMYLNVYLCMHALGPTLVKQNVHKPNYRGRQNWPPRGQLVSNLVPRGCQYLGPNFDSFLGCQKMQFGQL